MRFVRDGRSTLGRQRGHRRVFRDRGMLAAGVLVSLADGGQVGDERMGRKELVEVCVTRLTTIDCIKLVNYCLKRQARLLSTPHIATLVGLQLQPPR